MVRDGEGVGVVGVGEEIGWWVVGGGGGEGVGGGGRGGGGEGLSSFLLLGEHNSSQEFEVFLTENVCNNNKAFAVFTQCLCPCPPLVFVL